VNANGSLGVPVSFYTHEKLKGLDATFSLPELVSLPFGNRNISSSTSCSSPLDKHVIYTRRYCLPCAAHLRDFTSYPMKLITKTAPKQGEKHRIHLSAKLSNPLKMNCQLIVDPKIHQQSL
jgi:hypothetical protein